jgi:putative DeoR family transcriptional regulator (stage III sporulation protein D)
MLLKEVIYLKTQSEGRAVMLGSYIAENRATVRDTARKFGISKSTVHKDVSERLRTEDPELFARVRDILDINKQERHIRGGLATKRKYAEMACRRFSRK